MMDKDNNNRKIYRISFCAAAFVLAALIINFVVVIYLQDWDWAKAGQFGDMFGGVNALFSGLAFVGVIAAILLQSKELRLQQQELAETREVLKDQKQQLELQNQTINKQQFENTFFELLQLYNNITERITTIYNGTSFNGRDAIKQLYKKLTMAINKSSESREVEFNIPTLIYAYEELDGGNREPMNIYFRIVYSILKFIDRSDFIREEKEYYAGLLRVQLSEYELRYLALNCISKYGQEKMLKLMVDYDMFKHLEVSSLIPLDALHILKPSAYSQI